MTRRWLPAWGLVAVAFGGGSLIVPLYVVELGGDAFVLGLLFATGSFVGVPGALVFGLLADRTGKRRAFVLGAMALTVATMATIPLLRLIPLVVAANALLWLGFAAATPVLTLLVVDGEPESVWSDRIASLNKYQGIGWAAGLALGFLVVSGGAAFVDAIAAQRAFFLACAGSAGLGLVLGLRTLPADTAPGAAPSSRRLRRRVREAARFNIRGAAFPFTPGRIDVRQFHPRTFVERFSPALALYFGAVFCVFTGFGAFFAPLPAYLTDVGYGSSGIFGLYLVLNASAAAFYGRVAGLTGAREATTVQAGGLLARGLAFPLVLLVGAVVGGTALGTGTVVLVFGLIGVTWAVTAVTAATIVTRLAPPVIRGEALGVYGALVALAGGVGGLVGGSLGAASYPLTFGVACGLVLLGAALVLLVGRKHPAA